MVKCSLYAYAHTLYYKSKPLSREDEWGRLENLEVTLLCIAKYPLDQFSKYQSEC